MEEEEEPVFPPLSEGSDACKLIMERYSKSSAPQHQHLCAAASAMKSIILEENLPTNPSAYFAATITSIQFNAHDPPAMSALCTFLSIILPLLPPRTLSSSKACDAMNVLIELSKEPKFASTATNRSVLKSIGLLLELCDFSNWVEVKPAFRALLAFSIDRRPKVRKCAQTCLEKAFKSSQSPIVIKKASKMVLYLLQSRMPLAIELSMVRSVNGSKTVAVAKPEHLEVLHMLNALKLVLPFLSKKAILNCMQYLYKLLGCEFSCLTRQILNVFEGFFEISRAEILASESQNVIVSLSSYVSSAKNPKDTVMYASTLLKTGLDKLHDVEPDICFQNLHLAFKSVAGNLNTDSDASTHAAGILKEFIDRYIGQSNLLHHENQFSDDQAKSTPELDSIKLICTVLENILCSCGGLPDAATLKVISDLFRKLGEYSYHFMKGIVLKLSDVEMLLDKDMHIIVHFHACIGSAIIAMGPEKLLTLVPLNLDTKKLSCSNIWLIPILKKYVIGASLGFFMEHVVPLAESLHKACSKVKEPSLVKELQTCSRALWDLLLSFCSYPIDTALNFVHLSEMLVHLIKKDDTMHETIALALQKLVNQNKGILGDSQDKSDNLNQSMASIRDVSKVEAGSASCCYSKKIASRNIKAIASSSMALLQALSDAFFDSPPKKRSYLKDAIGCMASITEGSKVKSLFVSSLEKYDKLKGHILASINEELDQEGIDKKMLETWRCLLLEFAFCLVEGADNDCINIIFDYIRLALQADDGIGQLEAYCILSKIFKGHPWFYASRIEEFVDLLLPLKPPVDFLSQRSRFACLHFLLVHILKNNMENMSTRALLILNEIITRLKDNEEEARKCAYDVLLLTSSNLRDTSGADSGGPLQKLFDMIIGCLAGTHPHLMSGAVAALSFLIYKDTQLCFAVPNLVPSVLALLHTKAREVVKAVLGFLKMLVTCLQTEDLHKFLSDIVNGVLPWLSVTKNHFKSKVRLILEILIRKCSPGSVESFVPEEHRSVVRAIVEERHGKPSSKEGGNSAYVTKPEDSLLKRGTKRLCEELATPRTMDNSKEKRRKKGSGSNADQPSRTADDSKSHRWKKTGYSPNKQFQGQFAGTEKNKWKQNAGSGNRDMKKEWRRKDDRRSTSAGPKSRFAASSKSHKNKLGGKRK